MPAPDSLPNNLDALSRRVEELEASVNAYREQKKKDDATIQRQTREIEEMRRRLDQFIRTYFGGKRSEAISPSQMELALQGLLSVIQEAPKEEPAPETAAPVVPVAHLDSPRRARLPRRALDDDRLEQRERVIQPEEVVADPQGWTHLGDERTSQLDYEPGRLYRHVIVRPKYVRKETFAIAPLPAQPIDKGIVGPGLLAYLLMSKFVDHLPLHRLAAMLYRQQGIDIPRNTTVGWVEQAADLFKLVYQAMQEGHRRSRYLQVDETPVRYLDPDAPGGTGR